MGNARLSLKITHAIAGYTVAATLGSGEEDALHELLPLVYTELHRMARILLGARVPVDVAADRPCA